jgi:hypothetical protein
MRKHNEEKSRIRKSAKPKRAYETPRLIEFGSVAKLTAASGTQPPGDGNNPFSRMGTCL